MGPNVTINVSNMGSNITKICGKYGAKYSQNMCQDIGPNIPKICGKYGVKYSKKLCQNMEPNAPQIYYNSLHSTHSQEEETMTSWHNLQRWIKIFGQICFPKNLKISPDKVSRIG